LGPADVWPNPKGMAVQHLPTQIEWGPALRGDGKLVAYVVGPPVPSGSTPEVSSLDIVVSTVGGGKRSSSNRDDLVIEHESADRTLIVSRCAIGDDTSIGCRSRTTDLDASKFYVTGFGSVGPIVAARLDKVGNGGLRACLFEARNYDMKIRTTC